MTRLTCLALAAALSLAESVAAAETIGTAAAPQGTMNHGADAAIAGILTREGRHEVRVEAVDTPEGLAALQAHTPGACILREEPSAAQVGLDEPTNVMAFDYLFVTGAHVPDEVVTEVLRVLAANAPTIAAESPILAEFTPELMRNDIGELPWHPAAARFEPEG